jgi:hypothetical protein
LYSPFSFTFPFLPACTYHSSLTFFLPLEFLSALSFLSP